MFLLVLLSLIPLCHGQMCNNNTITAMDKIPVENNSNKTVGNNSTTLTLIDFQEKYDEITYQRKGLTDAFRVVLVRHRKAIRIQEKGVNFRLIVHDGGSNQLNCYTPDVKDRKYFQSLKYELHGIVPFPKDFYIKVSKCGKSLTREPGYSSDVFTSSFTTSSPQHFSDVVIILSVKIIEPLKVSINSISDSSIKLSIENLSFKEKTDPTIHCLVNHLNIGKFPYFNVSKLKKSMGQKDRSAYIKEGDQIRTMIMTMNCWANLFAGPMTCSAKFSGYSYWSNTIYLGGQGNMTKCNQVSPVTVSSRGHGSGITKLQWNCKPRSSSYFVFINETQNKNIIPNDCPQKLRQVNTTSCSAETDQLKADISYKVWVISSDNVLIVDTTEVLITATSQNNELNIFLMTLVGLGITVLSAVGIWHLQRMIRKWKIESLDKNVVQNLNGENSDFCDNNDIVILHITNSEMM